MKYFTISIAFFLLITACKKIEVAKPEFTVSYPEKAYKAGDTVNFTLKGNAQNITFYSGDAGFNYDNISRVKADGTPLLTFSTTLINPGEMNTLKVLASNNFNGNYTATNVQSATWTDITTRAALATSTTAKASGNVDLSDFVTADNKPVYLAYQYLGYKHATLKQPRWTFTALGVNNILSDGAIMQLASATEMGWVAFDFKNTTTSWALPLTGLNSIDGAAVASVNEDNDDWIVSRPLNLKKAKPDVGIVIQNLGSAKLERYSYIYTKAGKYHVVFLGFNNSIDDRKEIKSEFTITVNP
jgi:hypothetical protein